MKHKLKITVSKKPEPGDGVLSCRKKKIRKRLLEKIGARENVTIIVPNTKNVIGIEIVEVD